MSGEMKVSFEVHDEELLRRFTTAGDVLRERLRRDLAESGRALAARAASLAPRHTGALASTMRTRLTETNSALSVQVGPSKFYAKFLEFGVVNHGTAGNEAAKGGKRAKVRRVRELRSAGRYRIRPRPFMGPAMDSMRAEIDRRLQQTLTEFASEMNG